MWTLVISDEGFRSVVGHNVPLKSVFSLKAFCAYVTCELQDGHKRRFNVFHLVVSEQSFLGTIRRTAYVAAEILDARMSVDVTLQLVKLTERCTASLAVVRSGVGMDKHVTIQNDLFPERHPA